MVHSGSHHSEISFELLGEEWNDSFNYAGQGLGIGQKSLAEITQNSPSASRVYSDGLCLFIKEPKTIYSYQYTCREKSRLRYINELQMYPKVTEKKFITAMVCYPVFNNGIYGPEYTSYKDCVCVVPKNHNRYISSKVIKEKLKIDRHKCGLKLQPKQRVKIYSSSLFLAPK